MGEPMFKRLIASIVCLTFSFSNLQYVHAQDFNINQLPVPGTMVGESAPFLPLALKGLVIDPLKPLEFQFIVDTGRGPQDAASVKDQANQLVKYFLAGLTIPEGDLWVNLSPYEKNRMVPEALGQTDLGRDLLAQDYILKQLTASLIYPEKDLGKEFWSRVYAKAQQQFGTTNVPVNTFNKVWILPDQAQVFENKNAAYVTKSTLKVMLDEDYLAKQKHQATQTSSISSQIVREIVLPEIEKEVNTGKNFAPLHQIYQALILAKWYKETIQNGLLDAVYTNKNKVAGVNLDDPAVKEQIYQRYLKAYRKGAFNYIKEDPTPEGQSAPRKYFSGGTFFGKYDIARDGKVVDVKSDGAMISIKVFLNKFLNGSVGKSLLERVNERLLNELNSLHLEIEIPEEIKQQAIGFYEKGYDFNLSYTIDDNAPLFHSMDFSSQYSESELIHQGYGKILIHRGKKLEDSAMLSPKPPSRESLYEMVGLGLLLKPLNLRMNSDMMDTNKIGRFIESHPMFTVGLTQEEVKADVAMLNEYLNWATSHPYLVATILGVTIGMINVRSSIVARGIKGHLDYYYGYELGIRNSYMLINPLRYVTYFLFPPAWFISMPVYAGLLALGLTPEQTLLAPYDTLATTGITMILTSKVIKVMNDKKKLSKKSEDSAMFAKARIAAWKLTDNVDKIAAMLGNEDESVRKAAEAALKKIGATRERMIEAYMKVLSSGHSLNILISAAIALGKLKDRRGLQWLLDQEKKIPETITVDEGNWDYSYVGSGGAANWIENLVNHPNPQLAQVREAIKILRPDLAMVNQAHPVVNRLAEKGGIDLNQINVKRNGKTVNVQFDQAQLHKLMQGGFEGFTPVIINITPISSPLVLLGVNSAKMK
jgi:hypothetical protein